MVSIAVQCGYKKEDVVPSNHCPHSDELVAAVEAGISEQAKAIAKHIDDDIIKRINHGKH